MPHSVCVPYQYCKRFLREDFAYSCVYCTVHENEFGGHRSFHVEHFRPKSLARFQHLVTDYANLLYACAVCNGFKGNDWPSDDPLGDGQGYLDPCEHDYDHHFRIEGVVVHGLIPVARYMIEKLHLNRQQLKRMRADRQVMEEDHAVMLGLCDDVIAAADRMLTLGILTPDEEWHWEAKRAEALRLRDEALRRWQDRWSPKLAFADFRSIPEGT